MRIGWPERKFNMVKVWVDKKTNLRPKYDMLYIIGIFKSLSDISIFMTSYFNSIFIIIQLKMGKTNFILLIQLNMGIINIG